MDHFKIASFLGASAVGLGAFGAHGLANKTKGLPIEVANKHLNNWKTAASYQLAHAVLLIALSSRPNVKPVTLNLLTAGTIMFSGSIYSLVLSSLNGKTMSIFGPLTPIGGLLLVGGWTSLLF